MKKKSSFPLTKVKNPEPKKKDDNWVIWAAWADRITFEENYLKYDLEAKTYNDLIERFSDGNAPLVLVLAILPDDKANWAIIGEQNLLMNQKVYYFYPNDAMEETQNANTIRISIPLENKIGMEFFQNLFQQHYG